MKIAIALLACAVSLCAAGIDGRWSAEITARNKNVVDKRAPFMLDLKAADGKLSGSVSAGKKGRTLPIRGGVIDGNRITFTTSQKNKKADVRFTWTATLNGDQLTGTRAREGARKGQPFTAKRVN